MEEPLISILLPAYNVAPYLAQCIDSLMSQTYKNFELVIVNDGSMDSTKSILDAYACKNDKVRVFHTSNNGVSNARNLCLKNARGKYFVFVDPDDFVSPDMIRMMYDFLVRNQCDIVVCGAYFISEEGEKIVTYSDKTEILDKTVVIQKLFDDVLGSQSWGKMFKAELWDSIFFPVGRVYAEDVAVMHHLFHRAGKIGSISDPFYFYIINNGSLTNSYKPFKWMSTYLSFKERFEFAKIYYPAMTDRLQSITINLARLALDNYLQKKEECDEPYIEEIEKRLKESCRVVLKSRSMKFYNRLMVVYYCRFPKLYKLTIRYIHSIYYFFRPNNFR